MLNFSLLHRTFIVAGITVLSSFSMAQELDPSSLKPGDSVNLTDKVLEKKCGPGTFEKVLHDGRALVEFDQSSCPPMRMTKEEFTNPFQGKKAVVAAQEAFSNRKLTLEHAILIEVELAGRTRFSLDNLKAMVDQVMSQSGVMPLDIVVALDGNPPPGSLNDPGPQNSYVITNYSNRKPEDQKAVWNDLSRVVNSFQRAEDSAVQDKMIPFDQAYASALGIFKTEFEDFVKLRYPSYKHTLMRVTGGPGTSETPQTQELKKSFDDLVVQTKTEIFTLDSTRSPLANAVLVCVEVAGGTRFSAEATELRVENLIQGGSVNEVDLVVALDGNPTANSMGRNAIPNSYIIWDIGSRSPEERKQIWANLKQAVESSRGNPHLMSSGTSGFIAYGGQAQLPDVASAVQTAGVNANVYASTLRIFDESMRQYSVRHPLWKHTVDIVTGGASVTQDALILKQQANAEAQNLLGDIQNFSRDHSLEVHATQAYRDVLVQVQWCVYAGLLEASVRLPSSAQGLRELAQITGGTYSALESGAPFTSYTSNAISTHEIRNFQGQAGFLQPGFTREQLSEIIEQWGPKNNSADGLAEITQVTNKLVASIKLDAADAPREIANAEVSAWVEPIIRNTLIIDLVSPPKAVPARSVVVGPDVK